MCAFLCGLNQVLICPSFSLFDIERLINQGNMIDWYQSASNSEELAPRRNIVNTDCRVWSVQSRVWSVKHRVCGVECKV